MTISSSHNNIKIFGNIKISITSSVIGYLCKLTSSGCNVELYIANNDLYDLLDDLNLLQTLNVQRIAA